MQADSEDSVRPISPMPNSPDEIAAMFDSTFTYGKVFILYFIKANLNLKRF